MHPNDHQVILFSGLDEDQESYTEEHQMHLNGMDGCKELLVDWDGLSRNKKKRGHLSPQDLRHWHVSYHYNFVTHGIELTRGMDVELTGGIFLRLYDFISKTATSEKFLRGYVLLRNGQTLSAIAQKMISCNEDDMSSFLVEHLNELHISVHRIGTIASFSTLQCVRIFPMTTFLRTRRIIITNQAYPACNVTSTDHLVQNEHADDILVCRWVMYQDWRSSKDRDADTTSHCRKRIYRVSQHESDPLHATLDTEVMFKFRGKTIKGGASRGMHCKEYSRRQYEARRSREALTSYSPQPEVVDLTDDSTQTYMELDENDSFGHLPDDNDQFWRKTHEFLRPMIFPEKQRYSMADFFCGCGGATSAAVKAGLNVEYAVDVEEDMCATYLHNNPAARVACTDVTTFAGTGYRYDKKVDVLHLSPPCQPVSKSHTTPGKNDKVNLEALGSLEQIIRAARPRIVTMEEADALGTFEKHFEHLQRVILQLTMLEFSVEFRIIPFQDYGLSQKRTRLILIAACPGQRHPGFPERTHACPTDVNSSTPNVRPWIPTRSAIEVLPNKWTFHNPADPKLLFQGVEASEDMLMQTVITKNVNLPHPDGFRRCTVMEILIIQGFPIYYEFPEGQAESRIRKQIGNAVPPFAFVKFFAHIQRELLRDDGMLDINGMRKAVKTEINEESV